MLKRTKTNQELNVQDSNVADSLENEYLNKLRANLAEQKKLMEMKSVFVCKLIVFSE